MEILAIITAASRVLMAATTLASQVDDVTTIASDLFKTYEAVKNVMSKDPATVTSEEIAALDAISDDLDAQAAAITVEPPPPSTGG